MDYKEIMRAEMFPDIYDGEMCDQMRPRWNVFAEGDMDSDYLETLTLSAEHFPPGTRVLILEPVCPKCHQIVELCNGDDCCDFDWDNWTLCKYS